MEEQPHKSEDSENIVTNKAKLFKLLAEMESGMDHGGTEVQNTNELDDILKSRLSEFLTCYKIVGFDYTGRPVSLTKSHTALEKTALEGLFAEEFNKFFENKMLGR